VNPAHRLLLVAVCALGSTACRPLPPARTAAAPTAPAPAAVAGAEDAVNYRLYKFLQPIGVEVDRFRRGADGSLEAKANFTFNDRGTDVPLAARYELGPSGVPLRYESWGSTSRSSTVDDRVVAASDGAFAVRRQDAPEARVTPRGTFAVLSGYAPILGQQLLVRAWLAHGRPSTMALVPAGQVSIDSRGHERFEHGGKPLSLEHLAVRGLVWGRQDVWIDDAGQLIAVVTRDAEFDHFEAVRSAYAHLIDALVERAGADAVAWLAEVGAGAARGRPGVVALVGGRLVDGTGRAAVEDSVVVYDHDRIVTAGPRATTPVPPGAEVVDVRGKTVLPGLWDMHAHVEQVEQAAAYLAAGVTTVRDLGNILPFITAVRDAIDGGRGLGPRVLVDGLVDGDGAHSLGVLRINRLEEVAPVLDKLQRAGCLEVKIYSSMRPELVKPIADEAHRRGLRVTGHIPDGMSLLQALDSGYDGVNHFGYLLNVLLPGLRDEKLTGAQRRQLLLDLDPASPAAKAIFDKLAARKPTFDDTIVLNDLGMHTAAELLRREPGLKKAPRELAEPYLEGVPAKEADMAAAMFKKSLAVLAELHRRGVPVVAGTDIGVPGHSLLREIEIYVEAGFTPLEAIQAATIVPARAMRLDAQLGTIEPGKRADLVIVAGNPLVDIHDIRKIATVVARGRSYDPAALWKIAGFTP
jgi:imidazolonepropionase-like amidohydrolase